MKMRVLWQGQNGQTEGGSEPSEKRFRTWVLAITALIGPPLIFLIYHRMMFNGLFRYDALDLAQLGRRLSEGSGFVTNVIRPLGLADGEAMRNTLRQPDLVNGPLYPILLAMAFGVAGIKDSVVSWVSGLFYLLTIPVVYRLATKVFNRSVALITVLIFAFNALLLEYACSGLPITLEIFLATWLLLVMYNLAAFVRDKQVDAGNPKLKLPMGQLSLAGALLGLLYLTDTVFFWFIPVAAFWMVMLFAPFGRMRWKAVLRFALPVAILTLPWMFRYFRLGVNPFFGLRMYEVWMSTKQYPEDSGYRLMPGELIAGVDLFKSVVLKLALGLGEIIQKLPQITASYVLAFFLPSLLFRFSDPAANRLRQIMTLLFTSLLIGMLLFGVNMPIFVTIIPTMLVFSVAYLLHQVQQSQMPRSGVSVVAVLIGVVVVYPLLSTLFLSPKPKDLSHQAAAAKGMKAYTKKGDAVITDTPEVVAWYANRPAIYIPVNDAKVRNVRKRFEKARYLFLTEDVRKYGNDWWQLYVQLARWNELFARQSEMNQAAPAPPGIMNTYSTGIEFWMSLEGFVSQPPVKGGRRVAIMASTGPPPPLPGEPATPASGDKDPTRSADAR